MSHHKKLRLSDLKQALIAIAMITFFAACSTGEELGGVDSAVAEEPEQGSGESGSDNGSDDQSDSAVYSDEQINAGKDVYLNQCLACHGQEGDGQYPLFINDTTYEAISLTVADSMPYGSTNDCINECADNVAAYLTDMYERLFGDGADDDSNEDDSDGDNSDDSGEGTGDGEDEETIDPPSAVSTVISVASNNPLKITTGWNDNSDNETGFKIERKIADANWQSIAQLSENFTEFVDTAVTPGSSYTYRIIAFNSGGDAEPVAGEPVTLEDNADGEYSEEQLAAGKEIYIAQCLLCHGEEGDGQTPLFTNDKDFDAILATVTDTMPYGAAQNCIGNCAINVSAYLTDMYNELIEGEEELPSIPLPPTEVISEASEDHQSIATNWNDNSTNETGFKLERKISSDEGNNSDWQVTAELTANSTSYLDEDVEDGLQYLYRVSAFNEAGTSDVVEGNSVQLDQLETPTIPNSVANVSSSVSESLDLVTTSWIDQSDNENGFIIKRKEGEGSWIEAGQVGADQTTFLDSNVSVGNIYLYRVIAFNDAGNSIGVDGNIVELITEDESTCDYPQWISGTNYQSGDIVFNRGKIFSCLVGGWCASTSDWAYEPGSGLYWAEAWNSEGTCEAGDDGSEDESGDEGGDESGEEEIDSPPSAVVTVISVPSATLDRVGTSWTDTSNNETGFRVERKVADSEWNPLAEVTANISQFDDLTVEIGNTYTYRIIAFNQFGDAEATAGNPVELAEPEIAPEAPSDLFGEFTNEKVELSWQDNSNNESSFILERKLVTGSWSEIASLDSNSESFSDQNIEAGNTYQYRVFAKNSSGDSDFSNNLVVEVIDENHGAQLFSENCSGCHQPGGVGGDLFDGFVEERWSDSSFDIFYNKVSSMPVSDCDDECLLSIADYVWLERWQFIKDEELVESDDRGVRGIRLLTPYEYANSILDLTGVTIESELLPKNFFDSEFKYPSQAEKGIILYDQALEYFNLAEAVAAQINLGTLGCSNSSCTRSNIEAFGLKVFRRPLNSEEVDDYVSLQSNYNTRDMIASMLISPNFLYRVELGNWNSEKSAYQLNGYEVATQLSFQLWGTTPSSELLDSAASGQLDSASEIESKIASMVADQKFASHFVEFIRYYTKTYAPTDEKPGLSNEVIESMREEQSAFVEYLISNGSGTINELFNPGYTFINDQLANHYGMNLFLGGQVMKVNTDRNRGGILHQGITQIHNSDFAATSLVKRGKMIRENMMCHQLGVPSGVDPDTIELPDSPITTRTRWDVITGPDASAGQCWACHQLMNEPGSALENFDQTGKFREQELAYNDDSVYLNIEPSGMLRNNDGTEYSAYTDARELAEVLSASEQVRDCFAESIYRFHTGYEADSLSRPGLEGLQSSFKQSGDIKQLINQLLSLESAIYRLERE